MFALERIRLIRKYLEEHRQAEVHMLSELLDVSEVTVRRDLEKLENDGFLVRTHGGAILSEPPEAMLYSRLSREQNENTDDGLPLVDEVARTASRLVSDGDTVLVLGGQISRAFARLLGEHKGVIVLTNDLPIAQEVSSQAANRVVLIGGDLDPQDLSVYGPLAHDDIKRFHVDRFFAETDGFDERFELSSASQQKAALIRDGRIQSREFIILCLADRFWKNAFYRFGSASAGDTVVTDRTLSEEAKSTLFNANLRLFTAVDVFEGTV